MTLKEFCKNNPQLKAPQLYYQSLLEKIRSMDLKALDEKLHSSRFLMSRRSLVWILDKYDDIMNDVYGDFKRYVSPTGSAHTENERPYTKEDLDKLIDDIDDINF